MCSECTEIKIHWFGHVLSFYVKGKKAVIIGILMFSDLSKKTIIIAILMFSNLSKKLTGGTTIQSNTDYRSRGTKTKSKVGRGEGCLSYRECLSRKNEQNKDR